MKLRTLAILTFLVGSSAAIQAGPFLAQTVRITQEYNGTAYAGPLDVVVGPGVEVASFGGYYSVDLADTNVLLTFLLGTQYGGFTFNGFHLTDQVGVIPDFTSVTLASTTLPGFDSSRITFDANNIFVNMAGLTSSTGQIISLDVTAAGGTVPEPSSLFLAVAGIGLFALRRGLVRRTQSVK